MLNETSRRSRIQPTLKPAIGPKLLIFFVIGDVVGTGIYALMGSVAEQIGGALWLPFLAAFAVAFLTAFSYLELVGKYPRAAGAALYVQRAFHIPFLTFLVAFAVMIRALRQLRRRPALSAPTFSLLSNGRSCRWRSDFSSP